eukprot:5678959-Amphidinium_carterae.1
MVPPAPSASDDLAAIFSSCIQFHGECECDTASVGSEGTPARWCDLVTIGKVIRQRQKVTVRFLCVQAADLLLSCPSFPGFLGTRPALGPMPWT